MENPPQSPAHASVPAQLPVPAQSKELLPGKRGRGRPAGVRQSPETKLRIKSEQMMRMRIYRMTHKLINAQQIVAIGTHKMVVMKKGEDGIVHVETVRDENRMQKLLDEGEYGKDYLIVAGTLPDAKAADMLLNRAYGKAKESIDLTGNVQFSLKDLASRRVALPEQSNDMIEAEAKVIEGSATEKPASSASDAS